MMLTLVDFVLLQHHNVVVFVGVLDLKKYVSRLSGGLIITNVVALSLVGSEMQISPYYHCRK